MVSYRVISDFNEVDFGRSKWKNNASNEALEISLNQDISLETAGVLASVFN